VEVFIHRLRKKLEPMGVNIRTVRGMGYLIDRDPAS
jgi:two-component system OmpR family response regulator